MPAAGQGRTVERFTESVDVMPTLLALVGLDAPDKCDGASLLGFCVGNDPPGRRDEAHWASDLRDPRGLRFENLLGRRRLAVPCRCCARVA